MIGIDAAALPFRARWLGISIQFATPSETTIGLPLLAAAKIAILSRGLTRIPARRGTLVAATVAFCPGVARGRRSRLNRGRARIAA
jgi:hypothetical protein